MMVNSNKDFSVYINRLFQGAHNFFISPMRPSEHVKLFTKIDTLGLDATIEDEEQESDESEETSDVEAQLELFMAQGVEGLPTNTNMSGEEMSHMMR